MLEATNQAGKTVHKHELLFLLLSVMYEWMEQKILVTYSGAGEFETFQKPFWQPGACSSRLRGVGGRVRPLWVLCTQHFPTFLHESVSTFQDLLMTSWSQGNNFTIGAPLLPKYIQFNKILISSKFIHCLES
jgi:hypothetical protein